MSENLQKLAVMPRPRSHWQAIDAGMLLARKHYWKLLALWFTFSIPIGLVFFAIVYFDLLGYWVIGFGWWFKPLYELPILMYLSRALFRQPTSIRQALKDTKSQIFRLLATYLTLSRLSPTRSMTASVVFLEQQKGKARRERVSTLTNDTNRAYTLMLSWIHIEAITFYILFPIIYSLIYADMDFSELFDKFIRNDADMATPELLAYAGIPLVVSALVGPFYVASGFLLYINRRMRLEAWDIEHQFQDLETRIGHGGSSSILASHLVPLALTGTIALACIAGVAPWNTASAETSTLAPIESIRESVQEIYDEDDFGSTKTVNRLRFIESDDDDDELSDLDLGWVANAFEAIFKISRILVFLLAGAAVALVIWALMKYMPDSWQFTRRSPSLELLDVENHPLTKSLPADIVDAAQAALQQDNHREALSLLYRGALRTVMRRHSLSIPKSATEKECRQWVAKCKVEQQADDFDHVVNKWSHTAYANHQPTSDQTRELIDFWASNFTIDEPTKRAS